MQKLVISVPLLLLRMRFGAEQQKWTTCPVKIVIFRRLGGVPQIKFLLESSYFCYLETHAKILNTTLGPYGVLATAVRTRKEENKIRREKFLLTPMGVLAPGSAHVRPSTQPPINMSGNFSTHRSAKSP